MYIKKILISMVLLGIIIFACMNFLIIVQNDSNVDQDYKIINNTLINESFGDLQTSLDKQSSAEDSLNSLENVPPTESVGDLDVSSVVSATRSARNINSGLWNILIKLPMIILGVSPVVASAITTILLITIAIGIWAIWKGAIS